MINVTGGVLSCRMSVVCLKSDLWVVGGGLGSSELVDQLAGTEIGCSN